MKSTDSSMEESLENSLGNIGKKINDSHLKSVKILLTFFNSKWGLKEEFEKWILTIKQISPAEGQDESYIGKVSEVLTNRMRDIAVESLKCNYSKLPVDKSLANNFKVSILS